MMSREILYMLLILVSVCAFGAYEIAYLRNKELQKLLDEKTKMESELESYRLMYKKYEDTRIFRHDLKEQIETLKSLIASDNTEAIKYADKLRRFSSELNFTEYTDNNVLNILLNKKLSECHDRGIDLYIRPNGVKMSFLSELDTVAIFSNLINNAMEGCAKSDEKNIFIDFSVINDSFAAVKVENNCDAPPRTENGILISGKSDPELHGIGMKSIENSVKNYGGSMSASYDAERKFFSVTLIFNM